MLDTDLASLPAELQPQTPVLTRQELAVAAVNGDDLLGTCLNAYMALRGDYARLASAYVALTAAPPVILPDPRPSPLAGCRAWILERLGRSAASPYALYIAAMEAGHGEAEYYAALGMLQHEDGTVAYVDDREGGRYRLNTSVVRDASADADLSLAAACYRMVGSPFARPGVNIPNRTPVQVAPLAVYAPDMTVGTLPGENRAGDTLDEMLASPASMPTPGRVRAALAWEDIDDEPEETESNVTATTIKAGLARLKYALENPRDKSYFLG